MSDLNTTNENVHLIVIYGDAKTLDTIEETYLDDNGFYIERLTDHIEITPAKQNWLTLCKDFKMHVDVLMSDPTEISETHLNDAYAFFKYHHDKLTSLIPNWTMPEIEVTHDIADDTDMFTDWFTALHQGYKRIEGYDPSIIKPVYDHATGLTYFDIFTLDNHDVTMSNDFKLFTQDELKERTVTFDRYDENVLIIVYPTKYGVLLDPLVELSIKYDVNIKLYVGDNERRAEFIIDDESVFMSPKEPSYATIKEILDWLNLTETHLHYFGWVEIEEDEEDAE